jgi:hypothetical protein
MPLLDPVGAASNTLARFEAGLLFGILPGLFTSGHSFLPRPTERAR